MLNNVKNLPLKFAVSNDLSMLFDVSFYKNGMNCTKAHNSIVEKLVVVESMNLSIPAIFKLLRCICVQGIKNTESLFMNKIERSQSRLDPILCFSLTDLKLGTFPRIRHAVHRIVPLQTIVHDYRYTILQGK